MSASNGQQHEAIYFKLNPRGNIYIKIPKPINLKLPIFISEAIQFKNGLKIAVKIFFSL